MRKEIKFKRRADGCLIVLIITVLFVSAFLQDRCDKQLAEQKQLSAKIANDNGWLTKRNADLEKQIKLLEDKVNSQQATIDRLMKLDTVSEVEGIGMSEGAGEPLLGQVGIIQSMLDRSTGWNQSVKSVIEAPGQYAPPYKGEANDSMKTAFELVFLDGYRAFEDPVTHFYDDSIAPPYWTENKVERGSVGGHNFYGTGER